MKTPEQISPKAVERLSQYRFALSELQQKGTKSVFSHELGRRCGVTAAQVRRDLMDIGIQGSPAHGYEVSQRELIDGFLGLSDPQHMVLVGIGNLGRALLDFFADRNSCLTLNAAFDVDTTKVNRVIHGVRCYHTEELETIVSEVGANMGIITVPAMAAQDVARRLVEAGVTGLLNFAPVRLTVPSDIYVENLNLSTVFEKVAFFAWLNATRKEKG